MTAPATSTEQCSTDGDDDSDDEDDDEDGLRMYLRPVMLLLC